MDSNHHLSARFAALQRRCTVAITIAAAVGLSACGGASGVTDDVTRAVASAATANPAVLPTLVTAKSCSNITGSLDGLQGTLLTQLKPAVQTLPTVGATAGTATTALSQTLDTVDALTNALTTLASTQNATLFTSQLSGAGDSILCSGSSLSDALSVLATTQTAPIPGLAAVQQTLATVSQRVADGLVGSAPGADLTALTTQLVTLSTQLATLSATLPTPVNQPYLKQVLQLNATAFNSLALILGDLGALNGTKLASDVTALLQTGANSLPVSLATQFGLPSTALAPVTTQFNAAIQTVGTGLGVIAGPTLQAVSAVLGGVSTVATGATTTVASAPATFSDLLDGALTTASTASSGTRVTQLTQQLSGSASSVGLFTALLTSFGGVLPHP